jgi:hypothetical protein
MFVLYRLETRSVTKREEQRLKVSEIRKLERVFGLKKEELTKGCRKWLNEELCDLYSLRNIITMIIQEECRAEHVAHMGRRELRTKLW